MGKGIIIDFKPLGRQTRILVNIRLHKCFDPAHPHFPRNCLPNEEEIENFEKLAHKKTSNSNHLKQIIIRQRADESCHYQDYEARQTTKSNNNKHFYIQNSMPIFLTKHT